MLEDGYNSVSIPGQCPNTSQLFHSRQGRWAESGAVATEIGFHAEPENVPAGPTEEFTNMGLMLNTKIITLLLPQDKVLTMKGQAAKVASSPTFRDVIRLLGMTNYASMELLLARLHSHPLSCGSRKIRRLQLTGLKD